MFVTMKTKTNESFLCLVFNTSLQLNCSTADKCEKILEYVRSLRRMSAVIVKSWKQVRPVIVTCFCASIVLGKIKNVWVYSVGLLAIWQEEHYLVTEIIFLYLIFKSIIHPYVCSGC